MTIPNTGVTPLPYRRSQASAVTSKALRFPRRPVGVSQVRQCPILGVIEDEAVGRWRGAFG
jgi:hypothetical protein